MKQEELNEIERKRKTIYPIIKALDTATIIHFIVGFLLLALNVFKPNSGVLILACITGFLLIIISFVNPRLKNSLGKEISKLVYEPAFKEKNAEFYYYDGLTLDEVMSSNLFPLPDRFTSNSLVKGKISNFPYKASNITLLEEYTTRDSDGNTDTDTREIFDGRMYIIETPFNKKGIILISKNIKEGPLDTVISVIIGLVIFLSIIAAIIPIILSMLRANSSQQGLKFGLPFIIAVILLLPILLLSNKKKKYQEANLESSQFNKYFDIVTQDQVELRKTFTPAVMEKLINLRNSIGKFHLSIIGNKIFFAFPKSFYIKYDKPVQELIDEAKNSAEKEIKTIKSIIETLKLEEEKIKKGME
jgi:hypothetical protein